MKPLLYNFVEVVLTSYRHEEKELLEQLRGLGDFYPTDFKDVIRGRVENLENFLREIDNRRILSLSRILPVEKSFIFSPKKAAKDFFEAVKPLLDEILKGESFSVIVERRGLKGILSSHEVAKEVGTLIAKALEERDGEKPKVNLENPDKAIIFETLGRWCGVGIISRKMREKYHYLKLP